MGDELDLAREHALGEPEPVAPADQELYVDGDEDFAYEDNYEGLDPQEPEPWAGPTREQWQETKAFVEALAPLADLFDYYINEVDPGYEYEREPGPSYGDYLHEQIEGQVASQIQAAMEPFEEVMAARAERHTNEAAREQREADEQRQAAAQVRDEDLMGRFHEQIDHYARQLGVPNVDRGWVISQATQQLNNLYTQMRAQGFTDAQTKESLANHDALGFLVKTAVGTWRTKAISDFALKKV